MSLIFYSEKCIACGQCVDVCPLPEVLLLMRVHGVAGAKAAEFAGQALRKMEE
ncbi:MAG: 4Fe-4S binding protein [Desulfobaccales bacterium]